VSGPYTAHVTLRDQTVRRVDIPAAPSREVAAQIAQLMLYPSATRAMARPVVEKPRRTQDCCSFRAIVDVADSAFGALA
jgi:hypothetical protein